MKAIWLGTAYLLVVAVLAVLGVLQVLSIRHHDDLVDRRRAAVDAASNEVVALLSVSKANAAQNLKHLLAGATADFHDQLEQEAKSFIRAVSQGNVTSTGSVVAAALVKLRASSASVAVAAKATVTNSQSPKGQARNYRITVTVQRVKDRWLVSGLSFVV